MQHYPFYRKQKTEGGFFKILSATEMLCVVQHSNFSMVMLHNNSKLYNEAFLPASTTNATAKEFNHACTNARKAILKAAAQKTKSVTVKK